MPFQDIKIYGRNGEELHKIWKDQGRPTAYVGMQFYDFPNFCQCAQALKSKTLADQTVDMLTGPNTLSGHYSVTTIM